MTHENTPPIDPQTNELAKPAEKPRKKLDIIRERLQANQNVYFAGEIRHLKPNALKESDWFELVTIIISPKKPIFDPDELNTFMGSLPQEIPVTTRDTAYIDYKGDFRLGQLYFDEVIGKVITHTEVELDEPDIIQKVDSSVGPLPITEERKLKRRTWVRVYPDPMSAHDVYSYITAVKNGDMPLDLDNSMADHELTQEQIANLKERYRTATKPDSQVVAHKSMLGSIKQLFMRD